MEPGTAFPSSRPSGKPSRRPRKVRVTIRLDGDILDYFHRLVASEGRGNYQTYINSALREFMEAQKVSIDMLVTRILDEALARMRIKPDQDEMEKIAALEQWINSRK